ncbi:ABC-type multidrug transport system permease subunit [Alkalihalobacillus xiaoxiensis]|uniref:ABC-type multidrug transport system permease subunit n=1 Tax=Shouchella xiaoxiensis TaxID=766895 RepID=A0ABS2SVT8_9BACI|nr:hypothetical protein [Shouchella xiaoxiensis]MBM7839126.1 ABC-type multidrug transport system permease subunit [Shouchella xiaoxiensis]
MKDNILVKPALTEEKEKLSVINQYFLLLRLLITDYRSAAPFLLIIGLIIPMGFLWILSRYVGTGPETTWLLAGNIIMAVSFGSVSFSIQRTALMKIEGELDYYGSLSVKKSAFVFAIFTESMIFAFPALLGSMIMGNILLEIPWSTLLSVIPIALLSAGCLTILGSTLGSYAKTMVHFAIFSYLPFLAVFLSPVMVPLVELPLVLKITSYVLPTGQAVMALTDVLNREFDQRFFLLLTALIIWLAIGFYIAFKKLDWRSE